MKLMGEEMYGEKKKMCCNDSPSETFETDCLSRHLNTSPVVEVVVRTASNYVAELRRDISCVFCSCFFSFLGDDT